MNGIDCCSPCVTLPPTQIPGIPGLDGTAGAAGALGQNAYTIVAAPGFTVPAANANVAAPVQNAIWMIPGQIVIVAGPSTYQVVSVNNATSVNLKFLNYAGDVAAGSAVAAGAGVSPAGIRGPSFSLLPAIASYAVGGAQALTNSFVQLLTPSIVLTAGTWLIEARVRLEFVGLTYAANHAVSLKLRETIGPADIANAVLTLNTGTPTTITSTFAATSLPPVTYSASAGATIQIYGLVPDPAPGAGNIQVASASLFAIPLF